MKKQTFFFVLAFLSISAVYAFAAENSRSEKGKHRQPPSEAYTACEGKTSGDQAEFDGPRGDTVTGTCVQEKNGDRLFLRPDRPPKGKKDRQDGENSKK